MTITADIDPFEFVWSLNAERRHLPVGQKAVIWVIKNTKSQAWQELKQKTTEAANRARSEATKKQERTEDGTRLSGRASKEAPPDKPKNKKENKSSTKAAKKAGASSRTVEQATALVAARPDLAEKVASDHEVLEEFFLRFFVAGSVPGWQAIDLLKIEYGGIKPAIRHLSEESGIPMGTIKRWYYPENGYPKNGVDADNPESVQQHTNQLETCATSELQWLIDSNRKFNTIYADPRARG